MTSALLGLARDIALEAAELAVRRRAEGVAVAATKSSAVDVVTAADREVEALIRGRLADARPADGFLGEESGAEPGSSGLTWVVDPIDGTVNYLYGLPHYAVSIAVVEGGADLAQWRALAGVVLNAPTGELFEASAGGGARVDGRVLRIGPPPELSQALIATGFAYDAELRASHGLRIARMLPRIRDIRRLGAASLDLCAVAAGRVDAYLETRLSAWDFAAGALVVEEAGGRVADRDGGAPGDGLLLAGHPGMLARLGALLDGLG